MVLACFTERVNCSYVSSSVRDELACDDVVKGNNARYSFAVSCTFHFSAVDVCVGSDISSSCSSSAIRDGSAIVGISSEARSSMKPCCV